MMCSLAVLASGLAVVSGSLATISLKDPAGDCELTNQGGSLSSSCGFVDSSGKTCSNSDEVQALRAEVLAMRQDITVLLKHFGYEPPSMPPPSSPPPPLHPPSMPPPPPVQPVPPAPPPSSPPPAPLAGDVTALDFSGLSTRPYGAWQLAMNIDTGDGSRVDYCNDNFWTTTSGYGSSSNAYSADYKQQAVFANTVVEAVMIVVHEEGNVRGWRSWPLLRNDRTLHQWLNVGYGKGSNNQMAVQSDGADTGTLPLGEPMVKNTYSDVAYTDELWVNTNHVFPDDYNRLSTHKADKSERPNNVGWGLGTVYDISSESGATNPMSGCSTQRPRDDAQMHTPHGTTWGNYNSPYGGRIGTDSNNGGWPALSGFNFDYAIFVRQA